MSNQDETQLGARAASGQDEGVSRSSKPKRVRTAAQKEARCEYEKANRDRILAKTKAWRERNRDQYNSGQREWRERNSPHAHQWKRDWYAKHKDRINAARRAARQAAKVVAAITTTREECNVSA